MPDYRLAAETCCSFRGPECSSESKCEMLHVLPIVWPSSTPRSLPVARHRTRRTCSMRCDWSLHGKLLELTFTSSKQSTPFLLLPASHLPFLLLSSPMWSSLPMGFALILTCSESQRTVAISTSDFVSKFLRRTLHDKYDLLLYKLMFLHPVMYNYSRH